MTRTDVNLPRLIDSQQDVRVYIYVMHTHYHYHCHYILLSVDIECVLYILYAIKNAHVYPYTSYRSCN